MTPIATSFLPFNLPLIEQEEIDAAVEVLKSGWLTTGPKVKQFEDEFAAFIGAEHAVAVSSATAALHLALDAIGLQEGDEVIAPTLTFASTGNVVTYFGARPVLVDCEPDYFTMDPAAVERAISPKTKAIIPVHFAGHPCEMDTLLQIARQHHLRIIEDAAHSLPTEYKGRTIGTIGDITCFSFYPTKAMTTGGEGGIATTADGELADRIRMMRLHGITKDAWKRYTPTGSWRYQILDAGYKYNLTDLSAAIGLAQLHKCSRMWNRRLDLVDRYNRALADQDAFQLPSLRSDISHGWHIYVILVNPEALRIGRDQLMEELKARGIGTSVHFIPLHLHPYYQESFGYTPGQFPVAEHYSERCLSLPLFPRMSDDDLDRVVEALLSIAHDFRR
jgi:dTDP-4-amino-4,6-dideoxygalactose transaminase